MHEYDVVAYGTESANIGIVYRVTKFHQSLAQILEVQQ